MDRLWSPWRSVHVTHWDDREDKGDVFVRIAASGDDEDNLVLWRGLHVFVVMNLYPYNNGHCMVVPYRKVADLADLTDDEHLEMSRTVSRVTGWLRSALSPHGFNIGMNLGVAGGAGIPDHIHTHIVPRWTGDTNFMSTLTETRVVPEALHTTYRRLREEILRDD